MSQDGLITPSTFQPPPLLEHDGNHIVLDGGHHHDPLADGFLLVGGVLAPIPSGSGCRTSRTTSWTTWSPSPRPEPGRMSLDRGGPGA